VLVVAVGRMAVRPVWWGGELWRGAVSAMASCWCWHTERQLVCLMSQVQIGSRVVQSHCLKRHACTSESARESPHLYCCSNTRIPNPHPHPHTHTHTHQHHNPKPTDPLQKVNVNRFRNCHHPGPSSPERHQGPKTRTPIHGRCCTTNPRAHCKQSCNHEVGHNVCRCRGRGHPHSRRHEKGGTASEAHN
jgi:hypothetical protein